MRKILPLLLALALLCPVSASATAPRYIALTFEGIPEGEAGRILLDGMADRKARATFFLWDEPWEWGRRVLNGGHEIGLLSPDSLNSFSRRQISSRLHGIRALLPPCRLRLLMPEAGCSDALRQIAKVQKLSFPAPSLDPWVEGIMGTTLLSRVKSGDTLRLRAETGADVALALNLMDLLQHRGFTLVTVSELHRITRSGMI